ncbi:LmeA family phospholipid-binding protein [Nocardia sp. CA-120079]|uniref:LmeA family phospholipid-binding protein n=1 Tax=Nocardia sp. CA-120079 TaxID=3239974 RepID=UPI003D990110
MSTKSPSTLTVNRRALVITLVVVAILLATVLVGGEAYARYQVSRCISTQFEKDMGSKIDVSFGAKPMLITWIDGKVDQVKVNSDDSKFGPAVGMVVHARFNDVEVSNSGSGSTVGSSSADVTWGNDGIRETLGGLVSGVSSSASTGMLTLDVLGGLAQLQVKPEIKDGTVQVETKSAALLGMGIPTDLVSGIVEVFTQSLQSYPLGLKATEVKVTDNGVAVKLAGGRTELPAAQDSSGSVSC